MLRRLLLGVLVLCACEPQVTVDGGTPRPRDAGVDDSGVDDAGFDAGAHDAGGVDAGPLDAGAIDAGQDAGARDAGTSCQGVRHAVLTVPNFTFTCSTGGVDPEAARVTLPFTGEVLVRFQATLVHRTGAQHTGVLHVTAGNTNLIGGAGPYLTGVTGQSLCASQSAPLVVLAYGRADSSVHGQDVVVTQHHYGAPCTDGALEATQVSIEAWGEDSTCAQRSIHLLSHQRDVGGPLCLPTSSLTVLTDRFTLDAGAHVTVLGQQMPTIDPPPVPMNAPSFSCTRAPNGPTQWAPILCGDLGPTTASVVEISGPSSAQHLARVPFTPSQGESHALLINELRDVPLSPGAYTVTLLGAVDQTLSVGHATVGSAVSGDSMLGVVLLP